MRQESSGEPGFHEDGRLGDPSLLQISTYEECHHSPKPKQGGLLVSQVKQIVYINPSSCHTDKKEKKISSYIRKFRRDRVQSHIWL